MTTARDAPDPIVFGTHRGGVFAPTPIQGGTTDPQWCACGRHRVEQRGQACPACREGEAS